jgi:hypothetical protein
VRAVIERVRQWFGRRRDPERLREDEEARRRGEMEWRQAEQRKSQDQRGVEGSSKMPPLGRP